MMSFIAGIVVGVFITMTILCVCDVIHETNEREDDDDV